MNKQLKWAIATAIAVSLAACASTAPPTAVTTVTPPPPPVTIPPPVKTVDTTPIIKAPVITVNPLKDPSNILSTRIIYFDYDKDAVRDEFQSVIQAHAKFLTENRGRKIRLEGHADERGSREYNIALGQRRADAVSRVTAVYGVGNERMETISFGEEKPRMAGQDEQAWSQNRRVEIIYDGE